MNAPLWFWNLTGWSAQVALLIAAAAFLPRLLQIRHPRVLLACWRALLLTSLALPFLQPWHRPSIAGVMIIGSNIAAVPPVLAANAADSHWHLPTFQTIAPIIAIVMLAGISARFVILILGLLKLRQFRHASTPIPPESESAGLLESMRLQLNVVAEFRVSTDVSSPVTFGLRVPVILFPESFLTVASNFQRAIAAHELLHVCRNDWAHHLAEELIRACFWFHPAIVWLIARIRLAREQVVDGEVVRLTQARKTYLEALLEFTARPVSATTVLAPPFLAERQLAERVALMLQEVRMSRPRLIGSLIVISSCMVLIGGVAARVFPLKGSPLAQSKPHGGIEGGVSGVVTGGVQGAIAGGVSGGIQGGVAGGINGQATDQAMVERNSIWVDTVRRGAMVRQVRGLGTIVPGDVSGKFAARVSLPSSITADIRPGQNATVDTRKGVVKGHVLQVSGSSRNETRTIDVGIDGALPEGAGVNLPVEATIDIERLDDVLNVGRPVHTIPNSSGSLFKIVDNGAAAERVNVKFGRASVQTIEVLDGLKPGDKVILSDMSEWEKFERVHLK